MIRQEGPAFSDHPIVDSNIKRYKIARYILNVRTVRSAFCNKTIEPCSVEELLRLIVPMLHCEFCWCSLRPRIPLYPETLQYVTWSVGRFPNRAHVLRSIFHQVWLKLLYLVVVGLWPSLNSIGLISLGLFWGKERAVLDPVWRFVSITSDDTACRPELLCLDMWRMTVFGNYHLLPIHLLYSHKVAWSCSHLRIVPMLPLFISRQTVFSSKLRTSDPRDLNGVSQRLTSHTGAFKQAMPYQPLHLGT